ncbi:MAG: HlyD family efflux transporter periplasmic adaptor subunit, partial [Clostridiales bacterium]|nr:HlyD family efflux transporter periplasmic adaptor subunit [Clostridiales bacterium]
MAKRRSIVKGIVSVLVIAGLAGAGYMYYTRRTNTATQENRATVRTAPVIRGDIRSMVSGSGSVATSREQALAAPGASTLLEIHVDDGDRVSKGDVLFVLDCPEVVSSQQAVSKYEFQLAEYFAAKSDLQRVADKEYLVTSLQARVGDKLTRNGAIMSLLDISTMTLQVPAEEGAAWADGHDLQITLLEYGNTVLGTLIGDPTYSRSNGMDYLSFTLLLDKGQRIGGETYGQAHNRSTGNQSAVMLKPNAETLIKSPAEGYLEVLNAVEGDIITAGTLMYRIDSTNLDSQISDANSEMQVAMANLKQKKTTLTADFDGIYYAAADSSGPKNTFLQVGDSLRTNDNLGKIVDSERMQIVFNVDELDIAKVEVGQEVKVVADALPNQEYIGRVARIAQEGAGSGNVAYYWVLIEVTEWEGLKVGMTSSLEIVVERSADTLMVPINAVHTLRGVKYVILAEDQTGAGGAGTATVQGGQPGQVRQPGQGGQPIQSGQPGSYEQLGQVRQPGQGGQPRQGGQPGPDEQPGQVGQPGQGGQPG